MPEQDQRIYVTSSLIPRTPPINLNPKPEPVVQPVVWDVATNDEFVDKLSEHGYITDERVRQAFLKVGNNIFPYSYPLSVRIQVTKHHCEQRYRLTERITPLLGHMTTNLEKLATVQLHQHQNYTRQHWRLQYSILRHRPLAIHGESWMWDPVPGTQLIS